MKIIFICGALETGRDGVGDYTRRLAGELILQGHQAAVVAINDPYLEEEFDGVQTANGILLPVLRLPSNMRSAGRFKRAKEWIEPLEPDWLSLQFVPYAFHRKGLPLFLYKQFKSLLSNGRRSHIMFHETWVGTEGHNLKRLATAALQRMMIAKMIRAIRPDVIHTQLPKTFADLIKIIPGVKKLPLFSNIEVAANSPGQQRGLLRIGFFSQAEATGSIVAFVTSLVKNAWEKHWKVELLLMGGEKSRMKAVADAMEKIPYLKHHIICTGFLSTVALSHAIQSCSLGITTVPRHALGKSGSVAAFLAHGIPVAAPTVHEHQDPMDIGFFSKAMCSAILLEPGLACLKKATVAAVDASDEIQLSVITKTFLSDLA